jgi:RNA polymerase sigma-70 factor, ECF subfamily
VQETLEFEIGALHHMHASAMVRFAFTITSDRGVCQDAVQEAFLRYFIERRYGRSITNPRAWLYQVVRNYLFDLIKSASAGQEVAFEEVDSLPDAQHDPEQMVERSDRVREIATALSARELQCLRLRSDGLSYDEIGLAMSITPGTVGALLARAHTKFRNLSRPEAGWTFACARDALILLAMEPPSESPR